MCPPVIVNSHKLATADLSQVCDGRNWQTFRNAASKLRMERSASDTTKGLPRSDSSSSLPQYLSPRVSRGETLAAAEKEALPDQGHGNQDSVSQRTTTTISSSTTGRSSSSSSERPVQRRHSDDSSVIGTAKKRLPRGGRPPRRLSVDSNTTSVANMSGDKPRVLMRRLSEPMHRCTVTNKNVSGIMRPARYSSNNLVALANDGGGDQDSNATSGNPCLRRSVSSEGLRRLGWSSNGKMKPSMQSLDEACRTGRVMSVEWRNSMEVYVFTKTQT